MRVDEAEYWDAEADEYTRLRQPSDVDRATLRAVPPLGAVLELGAGPGVVTRQALQHPQRQPGAAYVATDISGRFCALLRQLDVQVLRSGHQALRFPAESLDTVYAMATLHHLRPADCAALLARLATWLRPQGRFALVEDWAFTPGDEAERRLVALRGVLRQAIDPEEIHPSEAQWQRRLARAGLEPMQLLRVPRPEDLARYEALQDPQSRAHLAWLHQHEAAPAVPMSIFVCRRARP